MAYDATGLKFDYATIFDNFARLGKVDLRKVNMGFEPGEQLMPVTPFCHHQLARQMPAHPRILK